MHTAGDRTRRRRLNKLSCAGWIPHDRGSVSGLPRSRDEHRSGDRLITGREDSPPWSCLRQCTHWILSVQLAPFTRSTGLISPRLANICEPAPFPSFQVNCYPSLALWSCGRRVSVVQAQRQIHRAFKPHWSGSRPFIPSWTALVSPLRADPELATRSRRHGHTGRPVTREPAGRCGRSPK